MVPAKDVAETVAEQALRLVRPDNPAAALGRAVSYLMTKPAFAKLPFGDWSRILVGQINRKHFCFAVDGAGQVQGFMGWALASEAHAKAWAEGRRALSFEDSLRGDCMVVNAFVAESNAVTRFLVEEARRIASDKAAIYFKRHYKDGRARAVRMAINEFVGSHVARNSERLGAASAT
jgi:hemolysin-activating ACP:hemolysin acyltransferase